MASEHKRSGWQPTRTIIVRNAVAWVGSLFAFCVADYLLLDYLHARSTISWVDALPYPAFYLALLWANKNLFYGRLHGAARWFAVGAVTLVVMLVSGIAFLVVAVWFHISIGGTM